MGPFKWPVDLVDLTESPNRTSMLLQHLRSERSTASMESTYPPKWQRFTRDRFVVVVLGVRVAGVEVNFGTIFKLWCLALEALGLCPASGDDRKFVLYNNVGALVY